MGELQPEVVVAALLGNTGEVLEMHQRRSARILTHQGGGVVPCGLCPADVDLRLQQVIGSASVDGLQGESAVGKHEDPVPTAWKPDCEEK